MKVAQRVAQKYSSVPDMWAKCLLGHCYGLWFLYLPTHVRAAPAKLRALQLAYEVLRKMETQKVVLPDEVGGIWGKAGLQGVGRDPRPALIACGCPHPGLLPHPDAALWAVWGAGAVGAGAAGDEACRHRAQHHHLRLLQQGDGLRGTHTWRGARRVPTSN